MKVRLQTKMPGLNLIIFLAVINAIITIIQYVLMTKRILAKDIFGFDLSPFIVSSVLFSVLPSFLAAIGLAKRKLWGWVMFIMASGAYLFGMSFILYLGFKLGRFNIISFTAMYFIFYAMVANIYMWSYRYVIDFD